MHKIFLSGPDVRYVAFSSCGSSEPSIRAYAKSMLVRVAMTLLCVVLAGTMASRSHAQNAVSPCTVASTSQPVKDNSIGGLWKRLGQGEPAAFSAAASLLALLATIIIASRTTGLSKAIRQGQIAQEHSKMALDINSELVRDPSLWVIHGRAFNVKTRNIGELNAKPAPVESAARGTSGGTQSPTTELSAGESVESDNDVGYSMQELKQLALISRYFNVFEYVHGSLGARSVGPPESMAGRLKREEWVAWVNLMRAFFYENDLVQNAWKNFSGEGIYPESFRQFITNQVVGKEPARPSGS